MQHIQRHISDFWAEHNSLEESRTYTFTSTPALTYTFTSNPALTGSIFLCGDSDCFGTVYYCTWPRADHLTVSRSHAVASAVHSLKTNSTLTNSGVVRHAHAKPEKPEVVFIKIWAGKKNTSTSLPSFTFLVRFEIFD